jgi:hypothetical protein
MRTTKQLVGMAATGDHYLRQFAGGAHCGGADAARFDLRSRPLLRVISVRTT